MNWLPMSWFFGSKKKKEAPKPQISNDEKKQLNQ
jgi:hypothetical protein